MSKANKQAAAAYIERANTLAQQHVNYVDTFVTRGNDELYNLLGLLMAMCADVMNSKDAEGVIAGMRKVLREEHNVRPVKDSHPVKVICRYVVPKSRKTAHVYSRVILQAMEAGVQPSNLPAFIKNAGGIDAVRKSVANAEEKRMQTEQTKAERVAIAEAVAKRADIGTVQTNSGKFELLGTKDVQFGYAICSRGADGNVNVVGTVYPNKEIEEQILSFYNLTCMAAAMDDGTNNFYTACEKWGFDMDLMHRWMRDNNIASYKEARAMVGIDPNAKIKPKE